MIDIKDTTFIIPVRIDSEDRIKNCFTTISYLLNCFDCNVIVKEVDSTPKFKDKVLSKIEQVTSKNNLKKLNFIYEQSNDPVFYRMQIINEMIDLCTTDIIVNYDADVLLKRQTIEESINLIRNKTADVVYPYGIPNYQIKLYLTFDEAENFVKSGYKFSILDTNEKTLMSESSYAGHVQFFNRQVYIEGGMENENFKGSAPEDWERLNRFITLEYNVLRLNHNVYHIEHYRGNNSYPESINGNPYYHDNVALWSQLKNMSKNELIEYYSKQEYLNKYKGYNK